jgi:hypothetical protein
LSIRNFLKINANSKKVKKDKKAPSSIESGAFGGPISSHY